MKKYNILYITDEYLFINRNKYKVSNGIIKNGKICNIDKFMDYYNKLLSKYNLNKSIFGDNIKIIVNSNYTNLDIVVLKNIFSKFNYRNIQVDKIYKYYKLNSNNCYINVNSNYLTISYIDEYKKHINLFVEYSLFYNIHDLCKYIMYRVGNKKILLWGSEEEINYIKNDEICQKNEKIYTFSKCELPDFMGKND